MPCKLKDPSLIPRTHTCNPSSREAETGRLLSVLTREPSLMEEAQARERPYLRRTKVDISYQN